MSHIFALILIAATTPLFAAEIPQGHSKWQLEECPGDAESGCNHSVSDVYLIRTGDNICGELTVSVVFRQPSAWFVGRVAGDIANVRFFDSFQSDGASPGVARINIVGKELNWQVLVHPKNGMIPSDIKKLSLISEYKDSKSAPNVSCSELVQDYSRLLNAADIKNSR